MLLLKLWMVHPNILPPSVIEVASNSGAEIPAPRSPRVEYLATLSRHSAAVNVVRWSPNGEPAHLTSGVKTNLSKGELIASAGDGLYLLPATIHTTYNFPCIPQMV